MATRDKALAYRGTVHTLIGRGAELLVLTTHPEGQPGAIHRIDLDKVELTRSDALPAGARASVVADETIYLVGTDGHLYRTPLAGGATEALGEAHDPAPRGLVTIAAGRLATLVGAELLIVAQADGAVKQRLALSADGSALASDESGRWIAVGTTKGEVAVFGAEDRSDFVAGAADKLHDGAVTGLLFEDDGQRFLSTGADRKLLTCHARGALEPEDRAGRNMHDGAVAVMLPITVEDNRRLITAAADGAIKSWTPGRKRPVTFKDAVARPLAGTFVTVRERPHLAVVGDDAGIRLLRLKSDGAVDSRTRTLRDAYAQAKGAFGEKSIEGRQKAIDALAGFDDGPAITLLVDRAESDDDPRLRVRAVDALGRSQNARSLQPLEKLLRNRRAAVRTAALVGLRARHGAESRRPLEKALAAGHADIGVAAVHALAELAPSDEQARARLTAALDDNTAEVRRAALDALEGLHADDSPAADLRALTTQHPDLRTIALQRLLQRGFLDQPRVRGALRRAGNDSDAGVRHTAFLIAVLSRPTLAAALRALDADLHRHLYALEHPPTAEEQAAEQTARRGRGKAKAKPRKLPKPKKVSADSVSEAARVPLLEAMASRALDTCVRGAVQLAQLGDGRAFGTLLQLSREQGAGTRVDACRALARLGDARAVGRVRTMLRDGDASVRDAAFSALASLMKKAPLDAAEAALLAAHEDVRRRGLELLVSRLRKKAPKKADAPGAALLLRALNDAASAVRSEAFKALVNMKLFGGGDATLRFALGSMHSAVRREVLTEVMGEMARSWAKPLLYDLFDDGDSSLRREAFQFALKRSRNKDIEAMRRALACQHADLRLQATRTLASKSKGAEARALLVAALDDADRTVRVTAIEALEAAEDDAALADAMASPHADVRVRAAEARATDGHADALAPLLAQVAEERPEVSDLQRLWRELTLRALRGLAELASPEAVPPLEALLSAEDADVRLAAVRALGWSVPADSPGPLRAALSHGDAPVRIEAAVALARVGDATGASVVFAPPPAPSRGRRRSRSRNNEPRVSPAQALEGAVALRADDMLLAFLDSSDRSVRARALRVVLLRTLSSTEADPALLLGAMSAEQGRTRLAAADGLSRWADRAAFTTFVTERLNDRGDHEKPWSIDAEVVTGLGRVLSFGAPRLQARAVQALTALDRREQVGFDRAWRRLSARHRAEIDALPALPEVAATDDAAALTALVFGAYVGLSRLSGGSAEARLRQTALSRLAELGLPLAVVQPTLVQALTDSHQAVRAQAFEALRTLEMDASALAAEALAIGQRDVGVLGLELLAAEAGERGNAVLGDVVAHDTDGLAGEAARLLAERGDPVAAWTQALDAADSNLRQRAVGMLSDLVEKAPAALAALKGALEGPHAEVRFAAADTLARRRDAAAFEPLVGFLRTDRQRGSIDALVRLGAARTAGALLDRLEQDPAGNADASRLLGAVGRLRAIDALDRLLARLEIPDERTAAFDAARRVTGHDQRISVDLDDDEELAADDEAWLAEQHPRHSAGFARLIEAVYGLGDTGLIRRCLDDNARWAREPAIRAALAPLATFGHERTRRDALMVIGWRVRHRQDPPAPLHAALGHRDPTTTFIAAEQLALAGLSDGIEVLLTAIDLDTSFEHRERAVTALGVLGTARALDPLMRLAAEEDHALQDAAATAIGRLAHGDRAEEVFALLSRLATDGGSAEHHALEGLRWFGTVPAWQAIRARAKDDDWSVRETVARLLGYHDDPDSRATLAERLREDDDSDVGQAALTSLRRQHGADSLEPDYLLVQSHFSWLEDDTVERLRDGGEPGRLLAVLPRIRSENLDAFYAPLVAALLGLEPAPLGAAAEALDGDDHRVQAVAARLLGRGGDAVREAHGPALTTATTAAVEAWQSRRAQLRRATAERDSRLQGTAEAVRWLLWAAGRLGVGAESALTVAAWPLEAMTRPLIRAAVDALSTGLAGDAGLDALVAALSSPDATVRSTAAAGLAELAPDRAATQTAEAVDDRATLERLARGAGAAADATLRGGASRVHAQGVVLPLLVARGDVDGLAAAAADKALDEAARMGALEALARIASAPAEEAIVAVARDDSEEDALRRAAWRARRRSVRTRARREEARR